ncbi:MAG: phosphonate ABC transporter, permease protein PhnE [Chloroflexia bacterium]
MGTKPRRLALPPWAGFLLSLVLPGLGQVLQGAVGRGVGIFLTLGGLIGLVFWQRVLLLLVPLAAVWLWSAWDAYRLARGRPTSTVAPFLLGALVVYTLAVRATELQPQRLIHNWPAVRPILRSLVHPDLLAHATEDRIGSVPLQVPCVEPLPEPEGRPTVTPTLRPSVRCAAMGETITVEGRGFFPDFDVEIWWQNPIGDYQRILRDGEPLVVRSDTQGRFQVAIDVPTTAVPLDRLPGPGQTQTHRVEARQHRPYGPLRPTETLTLVLAKIGETIALAFLATVLAVVFALPISLLAARNLMWSHWSTRAVYYLVRTVLNVVRSIETLIWAIVFGVWVGLGPFAGTLALLFHSIAALGKLYSEAIEGIDPGPIEAVRATGATWPQVVVYAVWPQFAPSFLAFTLFRWDINVRMSTVIGLVSNAGLGFLIVQWIRLSRYNAMATSIIAIVLVVAALDYASAALRRRIIEGVPSSGPILRSQVAGTPLATRMWKGLPILVLTAAVTGLPAAVVLRPLESTARWAAGLILAAVVLGAWLRSLHRAIPQRLAGAALILPPVIALLALQVGNGPPPIRAPVLLGAAILGLVGLVTVPGEGLRRRAVPGLLALALLLLFLWSWKTAEVDLEKLFAKAPQGLRIARAFLVPELAVRPTETITVSAVLPVPCGAAEPRSSASGGARVSLTPACGNPGDPLVIRGEGLPPRMDVAVRWVRADGAFLRVKENCCRTDERGVVEVETRIHPLLETHPERGEATPGKVELSWQQPVGGWRPAPAVGIVLDLSLVTLLMALLATTLGSVVAVPFSFLAARNVMGRTPLGLAVYNMTRAVLNLWRSVEPLIQALIFASWVGFGPFAGVLGLGVWNIPNLAKLFSEAIEDIDPGPVEAITSTGATRLQTLAYAVIPQLLPGFLAFVLYQWDISIRMSTVIGFVGGGGLGQQLLAWVGLDEYEKAATALWAIVAMVWGMDYVSARLRERFLGSTR